MSSSTPAHQNRKRRTVARRQVYLPPRQTRSRFRWSRLPGRCAGVGRVVDVPNIGQADDGPELILKRSGPWGRTDFVVIEQGTVESGSNVRAALPGPRPGRAVVVAGASAGWQRRRRPARTIIGT